MTNGVENVALPQWRSTNKNSGQAQGHTGLVMDAGEPVSKGTLLLLLQA